MEEAELKRLIDEGNRDLGDLYSEGHYSFEAKPTWLRVDLVCTQCGSIRPVNSDVARLYDKSVASAINRHAAHHPGSLVAPEPSA